MSGGYVLEDGTVLPAAGRRARERREAMKNAAYAELSEWAGAVGDAGWVPVLSKRLGVGMAARGGVGEVRVVWVHAARWRVGRAVGQSWDALVRLDEVEDFRRVASRLVDGREWQGRDSRDAAQDWVLSGLVDLAGKLARRRAAAAGAGGGAA